MPENRAPIEAPYAALERRFIKEFIECHSAEGRPFDGRPDRQDPRLVEAATLYASLRLAEIESRAHYVDDIHRR